MRFDDETNRIDGKWKFFKEVWCNLQGQYMHIVADLSQTNLKGKFYYQTIASLAIIGSDYDRPTAIPTSIDIFASESMKIEIGAVRSLHTIGNVLDIKLRQKVGSELSFATLVTGSPSVLTLAPPISAKGSYEVILESYD